MGDLHVSVIQDIEEMPNLTSRLETLLLWQQLSPNANRKGRGTCGG
jgi:hypothetical protein